MKSIYNWQDKSVSLAMFLTFPLMLVTWNYAPIFLIVRYAVYIGVLVGWIAASTVVPFIRYFPNGFHLIVKTLFLFSSYLPSFFCFSHFQTNCEPSKIITNNKMENRKVVFSQWCNTKKMWK